MHLTIAGSREDEESRADPAYSMICAVSDPKRCPRCGGELRQRRSEGVPWCTECEWNLGAFDPRPDRSHGRLTRYSHRAAFALDGVLFESVARRRPDRVRITAAAATLMVLSALLLLMDLALVLLGVALIVRGNPVEKVLGALAILLAVELRPRLGRLPKHTTVVRRDEAPALFATVDAATRAVGARPIHFIALEDEMGAASGVIGLRRRRVLWLGIPLWGALSTEGRLALLGHELGHFVNGDPTRSLLGQPAAYTFARLSELLRPDPSSSDTAYGEFAIAAIIGRTLIQRPLSWLFGVVHVLVSSVVARDSMRAEYHADALALVLGGPDGAQELMDVLLLNDRVESGLRSAAHRTGDATHWPAVVTEVRRVARSTRVFDEQVSIRYDASLFASHPPDGLRLRAMQQWIDGSAVGTVGGALTEADAGPRPADDPTMQREFARVARDFSRTPVW